MSRASDHAIARMNAGKQSALDKRNRGFAAGAHASWDRAAIARAQGDRAREEDTRADEYKYLRLRHIQQLAALEIFHNTDAKRAVEEYCRATEENRNSGTEVPF